MDRPIWRDQLPTIVIGMLDVFVIGLGAGVPVFAIVLGFAVGWWLARRRLAAVGADDVRSHAPLRDFAGAAVGLAAVSLAVLLAFWGPYVPAAFDTSLGATGFGLPLIARGERASMIAWLALLLLASPILQAAAVLAGAALATTLRRRARG